MKFATFFCTLFVSINCFAQHKELLNYWKSDDIKRRDGSKVFDAGIKSSNFDLDFISGDSVIVYKNGQMNTLSYRKKDSVLVINGVIFQIKKLTETSLILDEADQDEAHVALKLFFIPKKLADMTFSPQSYISKKGGLVYMREIGKLEPHFKDKIKSGMDYVFQNFGFPEYRKGGFVVRFVVTSSGMVKGVKIEASSNDRFNNKLIEAVYKTSGKWQAAEFRGEKVNVEMVYNYDLGFTDSEIPTDSLQYSKMNFDYGNELFTSKTYRMAVPYFTKAIEYNPLNIPAYYQRAACNIFLKKKEDACKDYQQLLFLEQKKGEELFKKYCK